MDSHDADSLLFLRPLHGWRFRLGFFGGFFRDKKGYRLKPFTRCGNGSFRSLDCRSGGSFDSALAARALTSGQAAVSAGVLTVGQGTQSDPVGLSNLVDWSLGYGSSSSVWVGFGP